MKMTATINVRSLEAKQGPNAGSKFAKVRGLLTDKSKAITFDANGEAYEAVTALADSFREKGFSPVVEIEADEVAGQPRTVPAADGIPAHPETWAGRPCHQLHGNIKLTRVVGKEPLPKMTLSESFMDSAVSILTA